MSEDKLDLEIIKSDEQWLRAFNDKVGYWLAESFEEKQIEASKASEFYPVYEAITSPPIPYQDMRKILGQWLGYSFFALGRSFERYLAARKRPFCLKSVKLVYSTHWYSAFLALKPEFVEVDIDE